MNALEAPTEHALWLAWRDGDAGARSALLEQHLPYARVVASVYYKRRHHDEIEFADYHQYARIGLLEAMERYDPGRGVQFRTFAARRMHGAILEGLERFTEKQQQIAARQVLLAQRQADVHELAAGRGAGNPLRHLAEAGLGLALCWLLDGTGMVDSGERGESVPFYRQAQLRQLRERLLQLVDALPAQERTVVRSHYLQQLQFEEVARNLGLTKGRISQIHKQALLHLREGATALELQL